MAEPVLRIRELVMRYGELVALDGVSLEIRPGEIFALLGPNGAGKTTLIGAVCGLVRKTSGTIHLFGIDLDQQPLAPRFHVGVVPQEINFDPFFTVREALEYQLGYFGLKRDPARIDEVLRALSLADKADARTRALSGGMKRRLLIAKALVHRPRLAFLDEPTAGVDVELRRDLWRYVRKLRDEGTTLVLTTHYLEEAEELADRIGVIDQGKLLVVEDKEALLERMGERQLRVAFARPVGSLPQEALRAGAILEEGGCALAYTERHLSPPAAEILRALYAAGLPVAAVETRRARLEDVMLMVLHGRSPEGRAAP